MRRLSHLLLTEAADDLDRDPFAGRTAAAGLFALEEPEPAAEDSEALDPPLDTEEPAPPPPAEPDADPNGPPAVPEPPVEVEPPPAHNPPPPPPPVDDPASISWSRLLEERPDVLEAYYVAYASRDPKSDAYVARIGGESAEDYARYWYQHTGRWEGYNQGPTTAGDNISAEQILRDRPDVLRAFYDAFYGPDNDRHSSAFIDRVGGDTPEAYAKYWYEKYGKWEGYSQTDKAALEAIDVHRLLQERPDVFQAFFTEYYGPNNDRHSSAWVERVGGDTVEDYAKYWYVTYGKAAGYSQRAPDPWQPETPSPENPAQPSGPPPHDPADDPWNHVAIFPDWSPPYEGWTPPPNIWHGAPAMEGLG